MLLLIDASGFFWRAYHTRKPRYRSDGLNVNAVEGFIAMVLQAIHVRNTASHVAIVMDPDGKNFRHELHPEYKANRPPAPEDLIAQKPLMRDAIRAYGFPLVEIPGFEADDVVATLTEHGRASGESVMISSSDKDLLQLVRPGVTVFDHKTKKLLREDACVAKFGVPPYQVVEVQSLMGDAVDNIPGVPGIGPKTACKLVMEFDSLDGILSSLDQIKRQAVREALASNSEAARLSHALASLKTDVPLDFDYETLRVQEPPAGIDDWLNENNLPLNLSVRGTQRFPNWQPRAA